MQFPQNPNFSSSGSSNPIQKTFSFQAQLNNSNHENKENIDNSLRKEYEFLLDSNNEQPLGSLNNMNGIIQTGNGNLLANNELDQMTENKNLILKKLKLSLKNAALLKQGENDMISHRDCQKPPQNLSTLKKPTHYRENDDLECFEMNNNQDEYQPKLKEYELAFCENLDGKLLQDYRRQIDLLERNFEHQKNQQNEINEYRKLINHFEEKINLLIDDNQRLVAVVEIEKEEFAKFKLNSEESLRTYQTKVSNLEKELKFREDRYNEAILCLDAYKIEVEKLKSFNSLTEQERKKLLEQSKHTNLRLLELEQTEEKSKNNHQALSVKCENLQSELKESKAKRETLETNIKEILRKNQILNKEMNERIMELNNTKKELETMKSEKTNEKVKLDFQIETIQKQSNEIKDQHFQEIKQLKDQNIEANQKNLITERSLIRAEEVNKSLEAAMKRLETELKEKQKDYENLMNGSSTETNKLKNELDQKSKENDQLIKEKELLNAQISQIKEKTDEILKANESLKKNIKQLNNDYQLQISNLTKSSQSQRMAELNEMATNFQKQMLEKTKVNNEVMSKNKELFKEIETLKIQKDEYKQKLTKMDFNYSKAMQELKKSYEQEKNIKNKEFQYQISEMSTHLLEKEKQINNVSREKQELLIILRKTSEQLNRKSIIAQEMEARTFRKMSEEKYNENDFIKRGASLDRIRNQSSDREADLDKRRRSNSDYRRSLEFLRENELLNNEIYRGVKFLY